MLQLPLHHYDEGGKVKPPRLLWWILLYLAKSLVVVAFALTPGVEATKLLNALYPKQINLALGLFQSAIVAFIWGICAFREKWMANHHFFLFKLVLPLLYIVLMMDLTFTVLLVYQENWSFHWGLASSLVVAIWSLIWVSSSKHLRIMITDWLKH